jgi:hypothetical protein
MILALISGRALEAAARRNPKFLRNMRIGTIAAMGASLCMTVWAMFRAPVHSYPYIYTRLLPLEVLLVGIGTSQVRSIIGHEIFLGYRRARARSRNNVKGLISLLYAFKWFCSPPQREVLESIAGDLTKDVRDMRREGRPTEFISAVIAWHVTSAIASLLWDGLRRLVAAILPIESLIRKLRGF